MKSVLNPVVCVLTAVLVWTGCGPGPVASDTALVDPAGWSSNDTLQLTFDVNEPEHRHDLQIGLRHNNAYPFSNLYLFVRLTYPNGRTLTDTCPVHWRGQMAVGMGPGGSG